MIKSPIKLPVELMQECEQTLSHIHLSSACGDADGAARNAEKLIETAQKIRDSFLAQVPGSHKPKLQPVAEVQPITELKPLPVKAVPDAPRKTSRTTTRKKPLKQSDSIQQLRIGSS
jgi:hypothetical protein